MKVDMPVGIKNKFTFHVDDIVTGEHREYEAYNIVLNAMWSRLVNFQPFFVNIHFGTGSGTFNDPARTSLYTHLGTKTATTEFQTRALPTSQWRRKIVLNPEEFIGATITEIGVAYGSTASNLVTHAAPKDSEGNPIAIGPKKDTEIITIYADMYFVLAENMYGGKIKWVTPLANNELLTYLMGGSYPTQQFRVGQARFDGDGVVLASLGTSANILVANWIKDTTSKKTTTPITRLGTTVGNGDIWEFGLGSSNTLGIFRGQFPIAGVYEDYPVIGNVIGTGDNVTTGFNLPNNFPNADVIKIDGVQQVKNVDYVIYPLKINQNINRNLFLDSLFLTTNYNGAKNWAAIFDGSTTTGFDSNVDPGFFPLWFAFDFRDSDYWNIGTIRYYLGDYVARRFTSAIVQISDDNENWTDIATVTPSGVTGDWEDLAFTPINIPFRYFRIYITSGGSAFEIREFQLIAKRDQIQFTTPPPIGSVITADYTLDYIPKDTNHVLDLQAAIQYGEVV